MVIYPDIEIRRGRSVYLVRGEMDRPEDTGTSPLDMAKCFVDDGAEWLHVVDLDRVAGDGDNTEIVREILRSASIPVQVGGGVGTLSRVEELLDAGATRVVLGTAAVANPELLQAAAARFPRRIVVSVDVWQSRVAIHGWRSTTSFEPIEFVRALSIHDLAAVIITDIDRDVDLSDSSFAITIQLAEAASAPVITSGTIKSLDDISTARFLPSISGAVVGRALHKGAFTLPEALRVARQ